MHWQEKNLINPAMIEEPLRTCIIHTGSLTRHLQNLCQKPIQVELENESWALPFADEKNLLRTEAEENAFVRISWLKTREHRLVYARTVIPGTSLQGNTSVLSKLGNTPLGEVLFADKSTYRKNVRYARLTSDCKLYCDANEKQHTDTVLWARQSLFFIQEKPLLISEVFLPTIAQCCIDQEKH